MLNIRIIIAATAFNRKSNLVGALCYLFNMMLALLKVWELQLHVEAIMYLPAFMLQNVVIIIKPKESQHH